MLLGTNLEYAKAYNLRIVLETIRLHGPISRAETSRFTALTRPTVSSIVQRLIDHGLVLETGQRQGKRGVPSIQLEINADGAFAVGLDLDRDHLTGVLVDFAGTVRQRLHYELDFPRPDEGLALMARITWSLIAQEGVAKENVIGVGVGLPGPLCIDEARPTSSVVNPSMFPGWRNVPVAQLLGERLGLPVVLENNATAAAIGERWYGIGRSVSHFYYVYFGIGLGGGVVLDGQPYHGYRGNAGELGYLPLGLLEGPTYLGELFWLPRVYAELSRPGRRVSSLGELERLFEEQDAELLAWLETAAEHLGAALLTVEHLFDPEAIVLGGRLPGALIGHLLERLETALPRLRWEEKPYAPKLSLAQAGKDAAALGLATLPIYASVAPNPKLLLKERVQEERTGAPWLVGR